MADADPVHPADLAGYDAADLWDDGSRQPFVRMTGPRRRADDHAHQDYWRTDQQHRFEDRMASELQEIKEEVRSLNGRLTLLLGALALIAFALPIVAPFVRSALNLP